MRPQLEPVVQQTLNYGDFPKTWRVPEIERITDKSEVQNLAEKLKEIKSEPVLTRNDAQQILGIYGKRRELREEQVQKSYKTIFPSLLGIKLSNGMKEEVFRDCMKSFKEMNNVNKARAKAKMADMLNNLKSNNFKIYESSFA